MTEPVPNNQMREALRQFLSGKSTSPDVTGMASAKTCEALAGHFASFLLDFAPDASCTVAEISAKASGADASDSTITLALGLADKADQIWIELPVHFVKSLFRVSLGWPAAPAANLLVGELTRVEIQFLKVFADGLTEALVDIAGKTSVQKVYMAGEIAPVRETTRFETGLLQVSTGQCAGIVTVQIPVLGTQTERSPSANTTLAASASRLMVEPRIRLPLRQMPLSEVAKLKRGDVLVVASESSPSSAYLDVRGNPVLACELGQVGGRYSARVISRLAADTLGHAQIPISGGM